MGKENVLTIRLSPEELEIIKNKSKSYGFKNTSEYVRVCILNAEFNIKIDKKHY